MQEVRHVAVFTSSPDCTPRVFVYRETWDDTLICWRRGRAVASHRWICDSSEPLITFAQTLREIGFIAPSNWNHWTRLDGGYTAVVHKIPERTLTP